MSSVKALQDYIFTSKYARWLQDKQRRETWNEAVNRVKNMMLEFYKDKGIEEEINWAYEMMRQRRVLGSQRALQFGGRDALKINARIYNCSSSPVDRPRFFQECLFLLLAGCGCGFSVQKHHVDKLPPLKSKDEYFNLPVKTFTIPDSIEGWADSVGVLMTTLFSCKNYPDDPWLEQWACYRVEFDYSQIRPKGSPIGDGTGKAPGPDGLRRSLNIVKELIESLIEKGTHKLKPINCHDIICHISDAVLSGGIRRCQPGDSEVLMSNGTYKFIKDIKAGDYIKYNGNNYLVLRQECTGVRELIKIHTDEGYQISTPEHRWLVFDDTTKLMDWVETKQIEEQPHRYLFVQNCSDVTGNVVVSPRFIKITHTENIDAQETYDIEIDQVHCYNTKSKGSDLVTVSHNSALISLFSIDDDDMLSCKTGNWWVENPQRQRANNSVMLLRDSTTKEQFDDIIKNTREFGEPGFVWVDNYECMFNPCFVGDTQILTKDGYKAIKELYEDGNAVSVLSHRLLNRNTVDLSLQHSVPVISKASPVALTQKLAPVYQILLQDKSCITVTANHRFPTTFGVRETRELSVGDELFSFYDVDNITKAIPIVSIKYMGHQDVYCLHEPERNSIIANGICTGNCLEVGLFPYLVKNPKKFDEWLKSAKPLMDGDNKQYGVESGWEFCNLSTINCSKLKGTQEEKEKQFFEACRAAAILGTLQAGFTKFDYVGKTTEEICRREALIGVSMTGMMDNFEVALTPEVQNKGAEVVKETNREIAKKIGINVAARTTVTKPEGSASLSLGILACGIHPHHATRYLRAVQANTEEEVYKHFKKYNPQACEKSLTSNTGTDDVIYFPIEVPDGAKTKNQLDAIRMLKIVKSTQINWVMQGKNEELCVYPGLQHSVSNTVVVKDDEWNDVANFIYENRDYFTGVSLLPFSGDKDYPQAPFCTVYTSRQIVREYGEAALWTSGLIELALQAFSGHLYTACIVLLNNKYNPSNDKDINLDTPEGLRTAAARKEFYNRSRKFADKYMDGDYKRLTYCMKDVFNWKRWYDLNRTFKKVDYTKLVETEDNTKLEEEVACAGGKCLI